MLSVTSMTTLMCCWALLFSAAVLRDINLQLKHGTVTALVGRSGAGKSTVAALLSRFYEPQVGGAGTCGTIVNQHRTSQWHLSAVLHHHELQTGHGQVTGVVAGAVAGALVLPATRHHTCSLSSIQRLLPHVTALYAPFLTFKCLGFVVPAIPCCSQLTSTVTPFLPCRLAAFG
jgi:energy-coupling factor transporter ATP-binding protein EcfA2